MVPQNQTSEKNEKWLSLVCVLTPSNVKTVVPTLLSVDLHPKVIGLRVYLSAYEKIKIIVKTKITETDSGVGITIKD